MWRSRRELSNAYFLGKFCLDTARNEPWQVCPIKPRPRCAPTERIAHWRRRFRHGREDRPGPALDPGDAWAVGDPVHEQNVARFRLYRLRFLQENTRFAAFFKIYQILKLKNLKFGKFCNFSNLILRHLQNFC